MTWWRSLYFVLFIAGFIAFSLLLKTDPVWLWGSTIVYAIYISTGMILNEIKTLKVE
jgi:hypothetical protein